MKLNNKMKMIGLTTILATTIGFGGYSILNKDIQLVVNGEEQEISTFKGNVEDMLKENNIKYDGNDIISEKLETKLEDGMKIEVIDVEEVTVREKEEIPFEVEIVEDDSLLKGSTEVKTEGTNGEKELVYKVTYHNGKQVQKDFIEELVSVEVIDKVVKKGTKEEVQVASSRGESSREDKPKENTDKNSGQSASNGDHMRVEATAYTGHSITATGVKPGWGTIAVDPKVIPYGTKVYIPQFDQVFVAQDCGGAIKGNKIDIYMLDATSVKNWGRRSIDIYVLG